MTDTVMSIEDSLQLQTYRKFPMVVERGEDVWIYTDQGERFLDLYGGHAVAVTGHSHPLLVEALRSQAEKLVFYSNLVYSPVRAEACEALAGISPPGLKKVFFVNSGAEANENAIKLARKTTGRPQIISFQGGFHGRTAGALSATGMEKLRTGVGPLVPGHSFAPFGDLEAVSNLVDDQTAGILLEPIQSMAGVRTASPEFYQGLRQLCDDSGAVLIYDEVQTGMGRTGEYFFAPRHGVTPDILTLAKGLASGIPMGAVLVSDEIGSQVHFGDLGSTFGGSPLACAALKATVEILREEQLLENVRTQFEYLKERIRGVDSVEEVLGLGYLLGLKLKRPASELQKFLLNHRIICGLSADPRVLRLLPPLTLRRHSVDCFLQVLEQWR
jgi:acetylornithine/succinyldiaminopimelate/putrescine aminotransferase